MNYLAHAYLSFNDPDILVGNMISDFVKGSQKFTYPQAVQNGIELHRSIDAFTDQHTITRKAKVVFKSAYGLYAGAFLDVAYDHFLANDDNLFSSPLQLSSFSASVYLTLNNYAQILPERFKRMLPYMEQQDWLFKYSSFHGIGQGFGGLVHRAKYLSDSKPAYDLLIENYDFLKESFVEFFPLLNEFAHGRYLELTK